MRPFPHVTNVFERHIESLWYYIAVLIILPFIMVLAGCQSGGGSPPPPPASATLTANVTTQGNFSSGEQNATYNITVSNTGSGPTSGTVTVADPPTGFTITAMAGTGWTCTVSSGTCTRTDALSAGQSFPPITVTGNVTASNGTPVSIPLNVSGGGISTPVTSTPTITVATPALTISKSHTGNFTLGQQGATYTVTVKNGTSAGATSAKVTVTETVPSGEALVSMAGTGWTCPGTGGANTCDRSDTLATNASYPGITVTVNVSATATSPQVNQVKVSGGGMSSAVSGSDSTTINLPDLSITKSHTGAFTAGTNATFSIGVSNSASAGPTAGAITVTDTLDSHFTFVSGSAAGWTCGAVSQVVTCTNPGPLAPGASATSIPLIVAVDASASGTINNTATVATFGDSNSANNSATDSVTFGGPDVSITKSHTGTFIAGANGTFNIAVKNLGNSSTAATITVTDTLASQFTFVSGIATGWSCGAAGQVVTCTNQGPIVPGTSAATIPLVVGVSASATGTITNTATVAMTGDSNTTNNSSTDSVTLGPDLSILTSHSGNFGAGVNNVFDIAVRNVGAASTSGTITVTDTLDPQFTFKSAAANGWNCSVPAPPAAQVLTCTTSSPIAPGAFAATIPLVVNVSSSASGSVSTTASVSAAGDTNSANNSSTDTANLVPLPESISVSINGGGAGGVIYAGSSAVSANITVANEGSGDVLTPTLSLNGAACDATTCGTIGSITGTAPNLTAAYTPPASLTTITTVTLSIASSITGSFPATANFQVYPAGTKVVKVSGLSGPNATKTVTVNVFGDSSNLGAAIQLLAAGYACPAASGGGTICGTLTTGAPTNSTTTSTQGTPGIPFTTIPVMYTPPAAEPNSPYDRPMILAVSNADPSVRNQINFPLFFVGTGTQAVTGPLSVLSRIAGALTHGAPITLVAGFGGDTGVNKNAIWTITANGIDCQPACGALSNPTYTWNGQNVTAQITYTPPLAVPTGAAKHPLITVMSADASGSFQTVDSTDVNINDGTCGTGNNSVLNGQYAFLMQGGGEGLGYAAFIGSFTADGNGNITSGILDTNRTSGLITDSAIPAAGSSYSVGSDNRGCLTLANSNGGFSTYRIALGTLDGSNHATQGSIMRFDDNSGAGVRVQGVLMKQNPAAFVPISGKYVFGFQGITSAGARLAVAGVESADGAGNLTNFDSDAADGNGNVDTNDTAGSGTYSTTVDANGRGTGKTNGVDVVFYIVNSSEIFSMSTDPLGQNIAPNVPAPIISGESRKQTVPSGGFTQTSLDGNAYVFYATAVDPSNGGNATLVGQSLFTTNGANTGEQEANDNGTVASQPITDTLTIAANGRATNSDNSLVFYLIGTDSAFFAAGSKYSGAPGPATFGYVQQQTGGPFTASSLSGQAFFGVGAPVPGSEFDTGVATFDGIGTMTINVDSQGEEGGESSETGAFSYTISPSSTGKVTLTSIPAGNGGGLVGFVVSGSKFVLISTDTDPSSTQLAVGQK